MVRDTRYTVYKQEKMVKSSDEDNLCVTFGIQACAWSCPNAGKCREFCYARKARFNCRTVKTKRTDALRLTQNLPLFETIMVGEISSYLFEDDRQLWYRIHDSGDFYDLPYARAWFAIIRQFPQVRFYAYTKMVSMFESVKEEIPENLYIVYSLDGREDHLIPEDAPHARVFPRGTTSEQMAEEGYLDCSDNDRLVFETKRIGLEHH